MVKSKAVEKAPFRTVSQAPSAPSELSHAFPTGQVPATSFLYQALAKLLPQQFSLPISRINELIQQLPAEQREILLSALPLDTLETIPESRNPTNDSTRGR